MAGALLCSCDTFSGSVIFATSAAACSSSCDADPNACTPPAEAQVNPSNNAHASEETRPTFMDTSKTSPDAQEQRRLLNRPQGRCTTGNSSHTLGSSAPNTHEQNPSRPNCVTRA